ncbi:MAG: tRNA (adenosine(37)-N6)-threonylcarbamoyltransferase complex transferase subunit TsaD [Bacteroidales bacterium]|nr:tRNA (adenosine(37)-N6)-threonylcarbamoyltransferase complex transferase subunit TsaD [Bacteroidales bacterium]
MTNNILAIESSCDDTSAAIISNGLLLSNVMANQTVHEQYGGVVPELASRSHQQNIVPVVQAAIKNAGLEPKDISAIAFTRGPGLLGSLLVGTSFTKGFSIARNIPIIEVNHLQGHILSPFIKEKKSDIVPSFPFLTMTVSGGHTQIVIVRDYFKMEIIGSTIDDAAGEAFDKCAKVMGLGYPGGPIIDNLAKEGNPEAFVLPKPKIQGLNFSFSGLKTAFLYLLKDEIKKNKNFIEEDKADLAASLQKTIVDILIGKLRKASRETGISEIAIGGGVAANSELREKLTEVAKKEKWDLFLPQKKFTTDNAAMIGIVGYFKYLQNDFASIDITPAARLNF